MATSFKDTADRTWDLSLTVNDAKRVQAFTGLNLLRLAPEDISDLSTDPIKLVDALFALVKPQADKLGVSDEDFGRSLAGDVIADATEAFLEAIVNFTPYPAKRETLRKALKLSKELQVKSLAKVNQLLDSGKPEKEIMDILDKMMPKGEKVTP